MKRALLFLFCCAVLAVAQQTDAPTPPPAEPPAPDTLGDYKIASSVETGYRFLTMTGNAETYQSQVNYGDGVRLLAGSVDANSDDGHGSLFDQLSLRTEGLGNDPYESAIFRVEKNGWYEYSMDWRLQDYFNPGLITSNGVDAEHLRHRLQDHDLVLLPHSKVKILLGYSRSAEDGPALTSFVNFNLGGEPLFEDVRRTQDEYRLGLEATVGGFKMSLLHTWEFFRDDSPISLGGASGPQFLRSQPDHGETPGWRAFLARDFGPTFSMNARLTYQGSTRGSLTDELTFSPALTNTPAQQILISGEASRPATAANVNLVWSPMENVSVTNEASFDQLQMNGNNLYQQFDSGTLDSVVVNFQFFGIRRISDAFDVNYRINRWFGVTAGYQYSTRRFRSIAEATNNQEPAAGVYQQTNVLNAGRLGFRIRPFKRLTLNADGELGHNSKPVYPISEGDYHTFNARAQYRAGALLLSAMTRVDYNVNSVTISSFSSHSRNYGGEASWTPREWLTFDAAWSKIHLNTAGGLLYFANDVMITGAESLYISNIQFGNAGVRFGLGHRADVYLGYSRIQDTGDGRSTPQDAGTNPVPLFNVAQTWPLTYDTPLARFTLKVASRVRFNAGWQHYRYVEQFFSFRNYNANTGYTSLTWLF